MDLSKLLSVGKGYRTYIAAAGLLAMAYVQYKGGDLNGASQSLLGALAVFGLRQAIDQKPQTPQNPPAP